jgi:uncharacterized protein with HEPN domain
MPRDSRLYLDDILGAVERIREYVRGMDYRMSPISERPPFPIGKG